MLFDTPIKSVYINKNATAHLYRNGNIRINNKIYSMHSLTSAIKAYRKENK